MNRCLDCEAPVVRGEPTCECDFYEPDEHKCLVCRKPIRSSSYRMVDLGRKYHHDCRAAFVLTGDLVSAAALIETTHDEQAAAIRHANGLESMRKSKEECKR